MVFERGSFIKREGIKGEGEVACRLEHCLWLLAGKWCWPLPPGEAQSENKV